MTEVKRQETKGKREQTARIALPRCRKVSYFLLFACIFLLLPFAFCLTAAAQDNVMEFAPPPLRTVTKDERTQLNEISDVKNRTKLALEMMGTHLTQAEQLTSSSDFDGMYKELGGFQGLLDNTLEFLGKQDSGKGKVLDNYKRIEINLRTFAVRLESIRREIPVRYEDYVRKLIGYVRDSRSKAIEPMFGNSVVPVRKPG